MGAVCAGIGAAAIFAFDPLCQYLITTVGWRNGYLGLPSSCSRCYQRPCTSYCASARRTLAYCRTEAPRESHRIARAGMPIRCRRTSTNYLLAGDVFPGRQFPVVYGLLSVASSLGSACGAWLAGYLFDVGGSYAPAFIAGMVAVAIACSVVWLASQGPVAKVAINLA